VIFKVFFQSLLVFIRLQSLSLWTHTSTPYADTPLSAQVYTGSRPFNASSGPLNALGITHVVTHNRVHEASNIFNPQGQVELVDDIVYLHCRLRDSDPSEDVTDTFRTAVAFISEAVQAGGVVLIQLYGRSQSAALGLAWLTCHMACPLSVAMDVVLEATRFKVDPTLMYLGQLATVVQQPMALDSLLDMFSSKLAIGSS
jgi:hypothetical protein